jgi:LPXTG-motif cell wall-anchored protein
VIRVDQPVPGLPTPFFYSLNHLDAPSPLVVGQNVSAGTQAGVVGSTTNGQFRGMAPHLHFEVRVRTFPGSYDRDTVDPAIMWAGLGIDWVGHHLVGGRESGGQLLVRQGGPSDCSAPSSVSGFGFHGAGRLGAYLDPATPSLKGKYTSKGASSKSMDENGPETEPPEYQTVVSSGGDNALLIGVGIAALVLGGAFLLKKRRERGLGGLARPRMARVRKKVS